MLVGLVVAMSGCVTETHDESEDYSVDIEGKDMKLLTIQEIADLWEIDADTLLNSIISEFELKGEYTTESLLEDLREEYKFSPAIIKEIAEEIKIRGDDVEQA